MNEDGVHVRRVDWLTAIPSLRFCDAVRVAVSPRALFPVAVFLFFCWGLSEILPVSWSGSGKMKIVAFVRNSVCSSTVTLPIILHVIFTKMHLINTGGMLQSVETFAVLIVLMMLLGFCAIPVTRYAGCQISSADSGGMIAGIRQSFLSWKQILVSSVLTNILLGLMSGVFRGARWLAAMTSDTLVSLIAFVYIIGCLVLFIGWLLSLAAIAIDRCDGPDALSRGISYVLSRWRRVTLYVLVGLGLTAVCDDFFWWLADLGAASVDMPAASESTQLRFGHLAEALRLSLLLCEISVAYLLLRNVEDGVSLQEIDGGSV